MPPWNVLLVISVIAGGALLGKQRTTQRLARRAEVAEERLLHARQHLPQMFAAGVAYEQARARGEHPPDPFADAEEGATDAPHG